MTDKLVDVSVIIPAYRAAQTIGRTLHSIARQTVTPREIVIVDDGSDDDTAKVARSFADMLAPCALKIVTQPNLGAGAARNRALNAIVSLARIALTNSIMKRSADM